VRPFYLHLRTGIYYAELVDPATGKKLSARSTGCKNEDDARDTVREWLKNGIPATARHSHRQAGEAFSFASIMRSLRTIELSPSDAGKIAETLKNRGLLASYSVAGRMDSEYVEDFLIRFWTYDKSPYVAEKLAHGQTLHRDHCEHSLSRIKNYWAPAFRGLRLSDITKAGLKAFAVSLASREADLAPATRNKILIAGTTPLKWAYENEILPSDITIGLSTFSGEPKQRGTLTPEEAGILFSTTWGNEMSRIGSLVAATTGLRCGEIRALQAEDVDGFGLNVRHSWSNVDGLKATKTNKARRVPLLPEVRERLVHLIESKPYGTGHGFIFWSADPDRPIGDHVFSSYLLDALIAMRIATAPSGTTSEEAKAYWRKRAVTFHSWRHFYSARMADRIDARTVMLATGHSTKSVFEAYADHALQSDLERVAEAANQAFQGILPPQARQSIIEAPHTFKKRSAL